MSSGPHVAGAVHLEDASELVSMINARSLLDVFGLPDSVELWLGAADQRCAAIPCRRRAHAQFHCLVTWPRGARWCLHGFHWSELPQFRSAGLQRFLGWLHAEPMPVQPYMTYRYGGNFRGLGEWRPDFDA